MSYEPEQIIPIDKQVFIDSVDVTDYVNSLIIEEPNFGIKTANVILSLQVDNILEVKTGSILKIYWGRYDEPLIRKFYGIIVIKNYDLSGYSVSASDELWKATGQTVLKLYDIEDEYDIFNGDFREIVKDIVDQVELTMTDETIDQTSIIIPQLLCDNVKAIQKLTELAETMYWDLWYNSEDRYVYMTNPENYPPYSNTLEVGKNVTESPNYNENIHQVINEVEIQGIEAFPSYIETFTGNGTTKVYQLTKKPIATYVKVLVNGAIKSGAVEGSSGNYDYIVNLNQSIITFTVAPPNTHPVVIEYTISELTNVTVDNPDSKDDVKGTRKIVVVLQDVATVDDATQRAQAILDASKETFSNFTLKAYNIFDINCRYKINFLDFLKNKDFSNLSIVKIKYKWPDPMVEISLGKDMLPMNNLISTSEERIKRLERNTRESIRLNVNKIFDASYYFIMDDVQIDRRNATDDGVYGDSTLGIYGTAKYGTTIESNFILGDSVFGILGESKLGIFDSAYETIMKRKYSWLDENELEKGTKDVNVDITDGKIKVI